MAEQQRLNLLSKGFYVNFSIVLGEPPAPETEKYVFGCLGVRPRPQFEVVSPFLGKKGAKNFSSRLAQPLPKGGVAYI